MVLASVSAAMFWGAFFLFVLGSVLALFAAVMYRTTEEGAKALGILATISFVISAVLGINSEVGTYRHEHPVQAFLAYAVFVSVFAYALARVVFALRKKKGLEEEDEATRNKSDAEDNHEPIGDGGEPAAYEEEEAESADDGDNGPIRNLREEPVQPAEVAFPDAGQDG